MGAKAGKNLELLVKALESLSAGDGNLSVECNAKLPDLDTAELREIDVLVEYQNGNHKTRIGIECKDKGRKVGVPDVEAYAKKISRLDIDKGVIVSSSGFAKTAVVKAAKEKIILQTIERATSFDWLDLGGVLEDIVLFREIQILGKNSGGWVKAARATDSLGLEISNGRLMDAIGALITSSAKLWKTNENREPPNNEAEFEATGLTSLLSEGGDSIPFQKAKVRVVFGFDRIFSTFGYFINQSLTGGSSSMPFATAASALRSQVGEHDKFVLGESNDTVKLEVMAGSGVIDSARSFARFVTWGEAYAMLTQIRRRHHINISQACDGLSVTKFLRDFDVSSAKLEFDGVNQFADLDRDGCATVTAPEEN